jgi:N-acyl-D-amino-acid deacylase
MTSIFIVSALITGAQFTLHDVDYVISSERVFDASSKQFKPMDIAICNDSICAIGARGEAALSKFKRLDYGNQIVSPGFIDPHTHSLSELEKQETRANLNYLTQGVTTVVNGNDGKSPLSIADKVHELVTQGIGTNVAFFIGHNSVRQAVMGEVDRLATPVELAQMKAIVRDNMQAGALGLSSGLYYLPGTFANTEEVIELAKVAATYHGIYETHLRDESSYTIGFLGALNEAIEIAQKAKLPLHVAHIKALGVDVWGQSGAAINAINKAIANGVRITADQYPWLASGTSIGGALVPSWVREGGFSERLKRLNNNAYIEQIKREINENIRRRGGAERVLITVTKQANLSGKTLAEVAAEKHLSAADTVIELAKGDVVKIASFNMDKNDVIQFMQQDWVVTSSDGSNGHPRKYASFPEKLVSYVINEPIIELTQFLYQSTAASADALQIKSRGRISVGQKADLIVFDEKNIQVNASYKAWNSLSTGFDNVFVNGTHVIKDGQFQEQFAGQFVKPHE